MPCYRCGVRQTDPSRGQSPWKRAVRQYSQILICPGCQDAADWMADLDRCSQCSSVHLIKRLGEVECRDCGTIVPPAGEMSFPGLVDYEETGLGAEGSGRSLAGSDASLGGSDASLAGAGRSPDLSEEVARALDRVLSQSLVSQSIQRGRDPEGKAAAGSRAGSASGSGAGAAGSGAAGSGAAGSGAAGAAAGRHRSARTAAGHHAAAHPGGSGAPGAPGAPGAERHRAARSGLAGSGAASPDEVRPGAFAE
jgi:hypothetical protein